MSAVVGRSASHLGGLSDDELVRLARGGDEPAFDAIVHRYRAPLVSYSRRWLDPHRAEEVVQHTFMKAYLCLRDDDRPLVLRPWLYRVAHNAALNAVEKKGSDWEELDENYDGVPQPPQVAEQRARLLEVVDGIGSLPGRQRDALLLNEFEGRCYADIASRLGTSESGVRGLLRRARRQLRETAAAVLLPFPALRELLRSDAGRLQVDRTSEVIGSAGAVGGAGVAGGLTKVAAGMLAAGTIAGGGTAIEHQREGWSAPAQAAEARVAPEPAVAAQRTRTIVTDGSEDIADAVPLITFAGAGLLGGETDPAMEPEADAIGGVEEPAATGDGELRPDESEPALPTDPAIPVSNEPEAEANDDADAGDQTSTQPKESTSDAPASGDPQTEDGTDTEPDQRTEDPAAVPATPLPPRR